MNFSDRFHFPIWFTRLINSNASTAGLAFASCFHIVVTPRIHPNSALPRYYKELERLKLGVLLTMKTSFVLVLLSALSFCPLGSSLAPNPPSSPSRRTFIKAGSSIATVAAASGVLLPSAVVASSPPSSVPTVTLKSEYSLPQIGFGLYKTAKDEVEEAMSLALKAGVRYFDTAQSYGTEMELGSALKNSERRKLYISTKISTQQNGGSVRSTLKKSLKSLQMSYVDVAFIHTPLGGFDKRLITYSALRAMQEEGFARSVGVANYGLKHLKEIEKVRINEEQSDELQTQCSFWFSLLAVSLEMDVANFAT